MSPRALFFVVISTAQLWSIISQPYTLNISALQGETAVHLPSILFWIQSHTMQQTQEVGLFGKCHLL